MENILLKVIIFAYGTTAVIDTIAYWPTIKDLYYKKKESANIKSFALWTLTALIGFLYSMFVLPDTLFRIVSGLILIANSAILFLSIRLKYYK